MSFDPSPTGYFPGINYQAVVAGATGVFIPYEDLESYDSSVVSGDIRQLVYSFNEAVADRLLNVLASADRPTQMTYQRVSTIPSDLSIRKIYTITMTLDLPQTQVASE